MFAIAIGIFLFVALSVAACRGLDALRADAAKRKAPGEVSSYSGPIYNRHGREVERR